MTRADDVYYKLREQTERCTGAGITTHAKAVSMMGAPSQTGALGTRLGSKSRLY